MTTLILEGYIVKERTDNGKMFYYSSLPAYNGEDFYSKGDADMCHEIDLPIKNLLDTGNPLR